MSALEADARLDARFLDRLLHRQNVTPFHGERLFDDHVLAVARRADKLRRVLIRVTRDVNNMEQRIRQHRVRFECTVIGQPCRALSSADESGRDDHTAVTLAWRLAFIAPMCAPAAQLYPTTATLYVLPIGGRDTNTRAVQRQPQAPV